MSNSLIDSTQRRSNYAAWLFYFILFTLPLGTRQQIFLGGMSIAKLTMLPFSIFQFVYMVNRYKIHPHLFLYIAFITFTTPSFLIGTDDYSVIFTSFLGYVLLIQFYYNSCIRLENFWMMIKAYIVGLSIVSIIVVFALLGADIGALYNLPLVEWWYGTPVVLGGEETPNGFATFFIPGLTGTAALIVSVKSKGWKLLYIAVYLLLSVILGLTFSRSAIIGAFFGTVVIWLSGNRLSVFNVIKGLIVLTVIFIIIYINIEFIFGIAGEGVQGTSVIGNKRISAGYRVDMFKLVFDSYLWANVFGIGYGNFYKLIKPVIGVAVNPHNIFIGIGVEFGLLAFTLFFILMILTIMVYMKCFRSSENSDNRLLAGFYLGSLFGLMIHGLFHQIYINFIYWYLVASAIPLYKAIRAREITVY